jgi:polyphosphate kinase 2 (PPK2 family)
MEAYETMVQRCSTEWAPWYIIPADSRPRRNAAIARVIRGTLEDMDLEWPDPGYSLDDFDFS